VPRLLRNSFGNHSPSRVTLVVLLAGGIVVLAAVLAREAFEASRAQRQTAERVLEGYAAMAAEEYRDRFAARWRAEARRALGPATVGLAVSPFDPLVSLDVLREGVAGVLPCRAGVRDSARVLVRLDLRSGVMEGEPSTTSAATVAQLANAARDASRLLTQAEEPWALARLGGGASAPFLVVGARLVRLGAPVGLYAFTVCPSAVTQVLASGIAEGAPLLPVSIAGSADNASVLAIELHDRGRDTTRWGGDDPSPYRAEAALSERSLRVSVAIRGAATGQVAVGSLSGSRVPLLAGLLAATIALAALAVALLRREHELARMRSDFVAAVSHQLRTPLTQILMYGETLSLGRTHDEAERREAAQTIVHEARHLVRMVEGILAFGRLDRARGETRGEVVEIGSAIAEVEELLRPLAREAAVQVRVSCAGDVRAVADATLLRQVLLNLLENAIKHGRAGGEANVSAAARDGMVTITVSDRGPGIAAGDRDRIWQPFVRLPRAQSIPGTGLGLAVVRDLVARMQGRAWVDETPGATGMSFHVELPAAMPAPLGNGARRGGVA